MILFDLICSLVKEVEREKGNFGEQEKVLEKVNHILKFSSMKYDEDGLYIESFSKLGIEHWKGTELELPRYLVFIIDSGYKKWVLKTVKSIEDIEYELVTLEDFEFAVVIIDGVIKEYNIIETTFNDRVVWKDPIFHIEYIQGQENKVELVYERIKLEEEIKRLVKEDDIKDLKVFNIMEDFYEVNFYVLGVVYSTSEGERPLQVIWGKSEMTFLDIAEEDEGIW